MQLAGPSNPLAALCAAPLGLWLGVIVFTLASSAADFEEVQQQFIKGRYEECARNCQKAIDDQEFGEDWRLLGIRALLELGRYTNALDLLNASLDRYSASVQMRLLGHEVLLRNGETERAPLLLQEINSLAGSRSWAYRSPADLVALGKAALLLGADPKKVLTGFFDKAKKADPDFREAYLASGQISLEKNDYDLASKFFTEGLKRFPDDPDLNCGLAQAYTSGDRRRMLIYIDRALTENTNHVLSHLLLAEHLIDAEEYTAARKTLDQAHAVNPWHPKAWAFRAVLSHLASDSKGETEARAKGLTFWKTNPEVDYLIGKKLSQKYRFAEGAAYQRRALSFDKQYIPSKIQFADDLLRLGDEAEGWKLAEEVNHDDGYDITAFNLVNLHDKMEKFHTLTNSDFIVRMGAKEAPIYGQKVLALLDVAKSNICAKYDVELSRATTVEVFPEQKDFGVRTFGMPGNPGYLGVCFGPVITANSPASQAGHPANWQAVLWHEFCHVVTLQITKNKMPRWLSEGISVYEERQANPTWGQAMNPKYREIILSTNLTPVGKLSAAFLTPKNDLDLQFAYYESYLVVEFLVEHFGLENLKQILHDLGEGAAINETIAKHTAPMPEIEQQFADFARERARKLGPGLDWKKPEATQFRRALAPAALLPPPDEDADPLEEPEPKKDAPAASSANSTNYYVLIRDGQKLLRDKKWEEAKAPLKKLIEAYPDQTGPDNAYILLALAHRRLAETNAERKVLTTLANMEADALDAYARLMELGAAAKDWSAVSTNAERYLAVNPLVPLPYRYLAQASEANGVDRTAVEAYETMLQLDPPDPAEAHYRIARLLHKSGDSKAKRHVLQALEEAPRFRDAQKLLLEMHRARPTENKNEAPPEATAKPPSR